jgi:threonine synthase
MRYVSTRGNAPVLGFEDVLLTGLARDGGLYVPQNWPRFSGDEIRSMRGLSYWELAVRVMLPFIGQEINEADFANIVRDAYAGFSHHAIVPLKQIDSDLFLMELFHGPTLAFKDIALQLLGRLFDYSLTRRGQRIMVIGATSGDTGSAALEACRNRPAIDIVILHPHGRVSEVQRRQMTSIIAPNVGNIALEGTFDDCQYAVKALFNDLPFRDALHLSAVNSINWARIMPQIVYYFAAALAFGAPERGVRFAVPSGNFGNVYAGYAARAMGLPIEQLIVATNTNDILHRFFQSGQMRQESVTPTLSPSMDIQVSSNFERLLYEIYERDTGAVMAAMAQQQAHKSFAVSPSQLRQIQLLFASHRSCDADISAAIAQTWQKSGELIDPHTATGIAAAQAYCQAHQGPANNSRIGRTYTAPIIALACAHPAKFPQAVESATGICPPLPARLKDLYQRPEAVSVLPNDLGAIKDFISRVAEHRQGVAA